MVAFPVSGSSPEASLDAIDINLSGVKLHFHDSSCIVGTITLPTSKSSVSICDDCMDLVSSSEGAILTSSWWTTYLLGSTIPLHSHHNWLFSLDDWRSNPSMQSTSKSIEHMENQSEIAIIVNLSVTGNHRPVSIVHDESKSYTSDVLQFLQSRRLQKENKEVSVVDSSMTLIEVRCYVESLLIQLNRLGKDLLEPVSKAEMSFICSMSLTNETHMNLDLSFYSLELLSLPNLVILARCSDACSTSSVFDLSFSKSNPCQNEFSICLPSLNIWLHSSDWTDILDLFDSYGKKLTTTAKLDSLPGSSAMSVPEHVPQISDKMSAPTCVPLSTMQETVVVLRSENIGIMFYFPMHVAGEEFTELVFAEKGSQNVSSTGTEGKLCKLLTFMTHSKSSELIISGKNAKFKCILEKTSGAVGSKAMIMSIIGLSSRYFKLMWRLRYAISRKSQYMSIWRFNVISWMYGYHIKYFFLA
ncbi:uncharacterized protein [Gossypium hirsutum]|uniref:Uncharacterized protein n=1 Tax=Gossypium hirsutum TaxID=3635 RepID=A0ABM2ZXP4_GOSHI|nr:uncharacterized protein LOC121215884 [Gossypium hirsutum]